MRNLRNVRDPWLLGEDVVIAWADGSYATLLQPSPAPTPHPGRLGPRPLGAKERRDPLELIEDRVGRRAKLVTSQLPADHWHEMIGDPMFGAAIVDRLVHRSHRLTDSGGSLRRLPTPESRTG